MLSFSRMSIEMCFDEFANFRIDVSVCFGSVLCDFVCECVCVFGCVTIVYLSASELVGWSVCGTFVVVTNSGSMYCVWSVSMVVRMVVGAPVVVLCSVNWFLWVIASGIVINGGRIGARTVDDNTNGRSVTMSIS